MILLLVVFAVVLFALTATDKKTNKEIASSREGAKPTQVLTKYKTQRNSEGSVIVEVTPLAVSAKENAVFSVSMDTHSIELNENLKEISILIDDMENEYKAINWDGKEGGHHIEGKLVFPNTKTGARQIKLVIYGIDEIDREFKWDL